MLRLVRIAALACFALGCVAADAATIAIHGSTTVSGAVLAPHIAEIEHASGATLEIVANGSGRGLADLIAGKADMAMISAPLEAEVAAANARTPGALDPAKLVVHQIGAANVAFVVHALNPVTSLTLAQIAGMLSGNITQWSEVGGADQPIVIVAAGRGDGVRSAVEARLLGGASLPARTRELPNAPQIVRVVAQLPNALGISAAGRMADGVHAITTDAIISQPLLLVTLGEASPDATKVIAAAQAVAQK